VSASGAVPPGMTLALDPTGFHAALQGTPTAEGDYRMAVDARDACPLGAQHAHADFVVPVRCGRLEIHPTTLPAAHVGVDYSAQLTSSCDPAFTKLQWSAQSLPPGMTLTPAGALQGKPTAAGAFTVSVSLADVSGSSTAFRLRPRASFPLTVSK